MSEELRKRIGDAYLNPTFVDGQVLLHTQLNEIVSVAKEGINENYYDIQRLIKGEYSVGNSEKINGALLSRYLDTTLQEDDNLVPSSQQVKAYIDTEIEKVQKSFDVGDLILEVNDLKTKVSTNENSISAVEISIEELKQSDNLISGNIKGLEEGIVAVNNSISALSGSLSATQEQVITNENTITELQEELSRQTSSLSSLSQNVNKLDSSVTAFGKDINTITENVSKLDEDVAEISKTVNSFNTTINDINTNVSNLEEQVSNTVSELSNVKTDIQSLSSLIGNINSVLSTLTTPESGDPNCEHLRRSEWEVDENGVNTRVCLDCGWIETINHTCSLYSHKEFPGSENYTEDYCYEYVTNCDIEGCDYESRVKMPHEFVTESNMFGAVHTCYTCGYSYEEEYV